MGSSLRFRATAGATIVVGAALVLGAVLFVRTMEQRLEGEVRATARAIAHAAAGDVEAIHLTADDDTLVQVFAADGSLVVGSPLLDRDDPMTTVAPGSSRRIRVPEVDDDPFLAVSVPSAGRDGGLVVVARTLDSVDDSIAVVTRLLTLGLPLLLLLVAALAWVLVGRALAPVDAIRREVDAISPSELHRRVSQPDGTDEIARLAATVNRMLGRIEDGHERQRRFVADASHELRSPVASIRQHVEVAVAHPERTSVSELAAIVLAEDLRLQQLVDDLLLLARVDEGSLASRGADVDVDDLVLDEARRIRALGVDVDATSVTAARVVGDRSALRRLVRNLGDNAVRHARGAIKLSVGLRGDDVVVTVEDDGSGVPEGERARVLERFVRLDDARSRDAGGAGLGLAIVQEVARAHGGSVRVDAGVLGGALVEVRLPVGSAGPQPARDIVRP